MGGWSIKLQGDNLINMLLSAEDMRNSPNCRMQAAKWVVAKLQGDNLINMLLSAGDMSGHQVPG